LLPTWTLHRLWPHPAGYLADVQRQFWQWLMTTLKNVDRILVFDAGKIVQDGGQSIVRDKRPIPRLLATKKQTYRDLKTTTSPAMQETQVGG
jgi:hypothetical protein